MARAIEKPRPELWPMSLARWGLNLSVFVPGITDFFLAQIRDAISSKTSLKPQAPPPAADPKTTDNSQQN
jgi:hypothetical protein